ncbi:hypothetical protein F1559_003770 [Cyanidiococcus yangmingshanensis]|uniref:phosphoserine phosphatase n=1 Tax=Cyanidiococcus yangmingshanensis TaxID=2690220 RepID=A0A7J7IP28_9RHOD|nr:hypothetical protein F1559_003770 [Cyanidiococcus yangmingshanensis]
MFCSAGWLDRSYQGQLRKALVCWREAFRQECRHSFKISRWNSGRRRVQSLGRSLGACVAQLVDAWRTSLVQAAIVEESRTLSDNAVFWRHLRACVTSAHERAEHNPASQPRSVERHTCDEWVITLLASTPSNSDMGKQTSQVSLETTTVAKVLCDALDLLSSSLDIVVHRMRLLSPTAFELGLCVATWDRATSWDDLLQRCRAQWRDAGLASTQVTVAFQREGPDRRYKRLAIFDLDSTLIQNESIDELAAFAGAQAQVARITEQAMRGEMDFGTAFRETSGAAGWSRGLASDERRTCPHTTNPRCVASHPSLEEARHQGCDCFWGFPRACGFHSGTTSS